MGLERVCEGASRANDQWFEPHSGRSSLVVVYLPYVDIVTRNCRLVNKGVEELICRGLPIVVCVLRGFAN